MLILKHSTICKIVGICILLLIALGFMITMDVYNIRADIAPPQPPSGVNLEPEGETTNVRMVAETVLIEVDTAHSIINGFANVKAIFTMRNLGNVEEKMNVGFPLSQTSHSGNVCYDPFLFFPPISDLQVSVNGNEVETQKEYQTVTLWSEKEPYPTKSVACWSHFPVLFPVGKDVTIQVTYTAEPYPNYGDYDYSYVLFTGDGWKDTIGDAKIIFQLPYELNDLNFISCYPEDCKISGGKVEWHYQNFNPESNIDVSFLPPPLWQKILAEKENIARNPNAGEAWGRLGKAYKESILRKGGFRSDVGGKEMYKLSNDAYQHAITLLPKDADWHYGYADLLCWNARWSYPVLDYTDLAWQACVKQIQEVFNINPEHKQTKELIEYFPKEVIDSSGSKPNYIILTPKPTSIYTPSTTPIRDVIPSQTNNQITKTATALKIVAITPTPTTISTTVTKETPALNYVGIGILILVVIIVIDAKFKKK